ncbi:MAG: aminomethyl transferase family protein [Natronomonas sp.]|uniref:aminomethyl transferase family protein n=1 Tax=Natronomonas sp. TaxID=2184060 RepID=UPI0028703E54|nr:aminomethyl transferase family protein [Natronomonas sp.]MDR9431596.1 aminomethyl transferase family protein [Natronomonas sp.]
MSDNSLNQALASFDSPLSMLRSAETIDEVTPSDHAQPAEFTNWIDEQLSWKETCYIGYWSFMPDLHIKGPDALNLLRDLTVNSMENFEIGQAKHAIQCNKDGKVIAEGILYRIGEEEYRTQHLASWPKYNAETGDYDVTAEIHDSFIYQVQGPNSIAVLEQLTDEPLREIDFMKVAEIELAGREVVVIRQGMSGEIGFELQGPEEYGQEIWDAIVETGRDHGLRQLGDRTHLINHLLMGFSTRGHHYVPAIFGDEMENYRDWLSADDPAAAKFTITGSFDGDDISDWYRSPVELGWERNIKFDHDFVGREALEAEVENPRRTTVTLVWDAADVIDVYASLFREGDHYKYMDMPYQKYRAMEADSVVKDGDEVGVSVGRGYSFYFRDMVSLCTIDLEHSEPGTEVTIVWGEGGDSPNPRIEPHTSKDINATVAPSPYKEDNRRADLQSAADD